MNNYRCPNCGCDEFVVAYRTSAHCHLELMDDSYGMRLARKDTITVKEEAVELAMCRECGKVMDLDEPKLADSAA